MNESEETEEAKIFSSTITCCNGSRPCPTVSQYQLDAPVTMQATRHLCLTQINSDEVQLNFKNCSAIPQTLIFHEGRHM